jgi:hypothetical protein
VNTSKMLAAEYGIAVAIVSWSAIKGPTSNRLNPEERSAQSAHYWPWPPTIVMTTSAFGILGMLSAVQPEIAGVLGAGFLLAQIIRGFSKGDFFALSGMPNSTAFKTYNEMTPDKNYYRILTF